MATGTDDVCCILFHCVVLRTCIVMLTMMVIMALIVIYSSEPDFVWFGQVVRDALFVLLVRWLLTAIPAPTPTPAHAHTQTHT